MSKLTKELFDIIKNKDEISRYMKEAKELEKLPFSAIFVSFLVWFEKNYIHNTIKDVIRYDDK